jgi:hypothetical protein
MGRHFSSDGVSRDLYFGRSYLYRRAIFHFGGRSVAAFAENSRRLPQGAPPRRIKKGLSELIMGRSRAILEADL